MNYDFIGYDKWLDYLIDKHMSTDDENEEEEDDE